MISIYDDIQSVDVFSLSYIYVFFIVIAKLFE